MSENINTQDIEWILDKELEFQKIPSSAQLYAEKMIQSENEINENMKILEIVFRECEGKRIDLEKKLKGTFFTDAMKINLIDAFYDRKDMIIQNNDLISRVSQLIDFTVNIKLKNKITHLLQRQITQLKDQDFDIFEYLDLFFFEVERETENCRDIVFIDANAISQSSRVTDKELKSVSECIKEFQRKLDASFDCQKASILCIYNYIEDLLRIGIELKSVSSLVQSRQHWKKSVIQEICVGMGILEEEFKECEDKRLDTEKKCEKILITRDIEAQLTTAFRRWKDIVVQKNKMIERVKELKERISDKGLESKITCSLARHIKQVKNQDFDVIKYLELFTRQFNEPIQHFEDNTSVGENLLLKSYEMIKEDLRFVDENELSIPNIQSESDFIDMEISANKIVIANQLLKSDTKNTINTVGKMNIASGSDLTIELLDKNESDNNTDTKEALIIKISKAQELEELKRKRFNEFKRIHKIDDSYSKRNLEMGSRDNIERINSVKKIFDYSSEDRFMRNYGIYNVEKTLLTNGITNTNTAQNNIYFGPDFTIESINQNKLKENIDFKNDSDVQLSYEYKLNKFEKREILFDISEGIPRTKRSYFTTGVKREIILKMLFQNKNVLERNESTKFKCVNYAKIISCSSKIIKKLSSNWKMMYYFTSLENIVKYTRNNIKIKRNMNRPANSFEFLFILVYGILTNKNKYSNVIRFKEFLPPEVRKIYNLDYKMYPRFICGLKHPGKALCHRNWSINKN